MRCCLAFVHISETDVVDCGPDNQVQVVSDEWTVDRNGKRFPALFELPTVYACISVPKVDTPVADKIARRFRVLNVNPEFPENAFRFDIEIPNGYELCKGISSWRWRHCVEFARSRNAQRHTFMLLRTAT